MRKILDYTTVPCHDVMRKVEEGYRPFGSAFYDRDTGGGVQPVILYAPETSIPQLDLTARHKKPDYVDLENGTRVHLLADDPKAPGPYDGRMSTWNADDNPAQPGGGSS